MKSAWFETARRNALRVGAVLALACVGAIVLLLSRDSGGRRHLAGHEPAALHSSSPGDALPGSSSNDIGSADGSPRILGRGDATLTIQFPHLGPAALAGRKEILAVSTPDLCMKIAVVKERTTLSVQANVPITLGLPDAMGALDFFVRPLRIGERRVVDLSGRYENSLVLEDGSRPPDPKIVPFSLSLYDGREVTVRHLPYTLPALLDGLRQLTLRWPGCALSHRAISLGPERRRAVMKIRRPQGTSIELRTVFEDGRPAPLVPFVIESLYDARETGPPLAEGTTDRQGRAVVEGLPMEETLAVLNLPHDVNTPSLSRIELQPFDLSGTTRRVTARVTKSPGFLLHFSDDWPKQTSVQVEVNEEADDATKSPNQPRTAFQWEYSFFSPTSRDMLLPVAKARREYRLCVGASLAELLPVRIDTVSGSAGEVTPITVTPRKTSRKLRVGVKVDPVLARMHPHFQLLVYDDSPADWLRDSWVTPGTTVTVPVESDHAYTLELCWNGFPTSVKTDVQPEDFERTVFLDASGLRKVSFRLVYPSAAAAEPGADGVAGDFDSDESWTLFAGGAAAYENTIDMPAFGTRAEGVLREGTYRFSLIADTPLHASWQGVHVSGESPTVELRLPDVRRVECTIRLEPAPSSPVEVDLSDDQPEAFCPTSGTLGPLRLPAGSRFHVEVHEQHGHDTLDDWDFLSADTFHAEFRVTDAAHQTITLHGRPVLFLWTSIPKGIDGKPVEEPRLPGVPDGLDVNGEILSIDGVKVSRRAEAIRRLLAGAEVRWRDGDGVHLTSWPRGVVPYVDESFLAAHGPAPAHR